MKLIQNNYTFLEKIRRITLVVLKHLSIPFVKYHFFLKFQLINSFISQFLNFTILPERAIN